MDRGRKMATDTEGGQGKEVRVESSRVEGREGKGREGKEVRVKWSRVK